MKILFLTFHNPGDVRDDWFWPTLERLKPIGELAGYVNTYIDGEEELFYKVESQLTDHDFTHVCVIPFGAEISDSFMEIMNDYIEERDEKAIYMPLVVLQAKETKGILNASIWNSNLADEIGVLTHELAMKQVDSTLYGCLIPRELFFDEKNYKPGLKYYQHFHFLNNVTKDENNIVLGVPKTLIYTDIDLSYATATQEEKKLFFMEANKIEQPALAEAEA